MNPTILILTGLAAVAVLAAVALVVMGKGGQLAGSEADHTPLDLPADRPVTGADVARIRLPLSMWGYHVRAVDEALRQVAEALKERDARIEELESRLDGRHARHDATDVLPAAAEPDGGATAAPGAGSETGPVPPAGPFLDEPIGVAGGSEADTAGEPGADHGPAADRDSESVADHGDADPDPDHPGPQHAQESAQRRASDTPDHAADDDPHSGPRTVRTGAGPGDGPAGR